MSKPIPGFDYRTNTAVSFTRKEWRERIREAQAKGGHARTGIVPRETWIRDAAGALQYEVYAVLPVS